MRRERENVMSETLNFFSWSSMWCLASLITVNWTFHHRYIVHTNVLERRACDGGEIKTHAVTSVEQQQQRWWIKKQHQHQYIRIHISYYCDEVHARPHRTLLEVWHFYFQLFLSLSTRRRSTRIMARPARAILTMKLNIYPKQPPARTSAWLDKDSAMVSSLYIATGVLYCLFVIERTLDGT